MGLKGAQAVSQVCGEIPVLNAGEPRKLEDWRQMEACGMRGVAVKCIEIAQNSDCEGSMPCLD